MAFDLPTPVDRGPRQIALRATVAAPPQEVFALVADPARHPELDGSGTVGALIRGAAPLREGDTFTIAMKQFGVPYTITSTVTALEPDRLVEWQHPQAHRWRWELEPLPTGGTLVTETFDYRDSRIGLLLRLSRTPRRNARGIEATLQALQERFGR